ncbi:hypothetical protein TWF788_003245 [Orbilia oligospora]|uniref:Uncharacterized protein n=1 Tax=Orbilia oligospora TaxID=2813651 RepID=A0A7C8TYI3_ORBOL|nr:hypothetical protein TWF788_003245 [Orbilia oligospora]
MTENECPCNYLQAELDQAKETANYYFHEYRSASVYISNQRMQMLHEQSILRETQRQLHQVIRELHWYQAEFPGAQSRYYLETSPGEKLQGGLLVQKPLPEIPHAQPLKTTAQAKKTKNNNGSKIRKAIRPNELRRSLRLQGIDVITEEI